MTNEWQMSAITIVKALLWLHIAQSKKKKTFCMVWLVSEGPGLHLSACVNAQTSTAAHFAASPGNSVVTDTECVGLPSSRKLTLHSDTVIMACCYMQTPWEMRVWDGETTRLIPTACILAHKMTNYFKIEFAKNTLLYILVFVCGCAYRIQSVNVHLKKHFFTQRHPKTCTGLIFKYK